MTSKELLKVAVVLTMVASAGTAMASSSVTGAVAMGPSGSFAPSANVTMHIAAGDTQYAADAVHYSGNRLYFGNSVDSKLYYKTKAVGDSTGFVTTSDTTVAADSTWSSL